MSVLKGGSDITVERLNALLSDYSVTNIEVIEEKEENLPILVCCNCIYGYDSDLGSIVPIATLVSDDIVYAHGYSPEHKLGLYVVEWMKRRLT